MNTRVHRLRVNFQNELIHYRSERLQLATLLGASDPFGFLIPLISAHLQDMRPTPLLLLLSSLLLSSLLRPAAGSPSTLPGWPDEPGRLHAQQLEQMLRRAAAAGDGPASELLDELILKFLPRRSPELLHFLPAARTEEEAAAQQLLLKRNAEPPLSIDLTFHMLRNMMQMAKMENMREQEQINRKFLEEVGK